jgi:hypothetical protein
MGPTAPRESRSTLLQSPPRGSEGPRPARGRAHAGFGRITSNKFTAPSLPVTEL